MTDWLETTPTLAELIPITTTTHVKLAAAYPDNADSKGNMYLFGWQLKEIIDPYEVDVTPIKDKYIYEIYNENPYRLGFHLHAIGEMRTNVRYQDEYTSENNRLVRIFVLGKQERRNFRGEYYLSGRELKGLGVTEYRSSNGSKCVRNDAIYYFPAEHVGWNKHKAFANGETENNYVNYIREVYTSAGELLDDVNRLNETFASYKSVYKVLDKQYEKRCKEERMCTKQ